MKPVRVVDAIYTIGPLRCVRCGWLDPDRPYAFGILRYACAVCRADHVALRIPPGTTWSLLRELFDLPVIHALMPDETEDLDAALPVEFAPLYLIRSPDTAEPPLGWKRAAELLALY